MLLQVLVQMHEHKRGHCDIKTENIMVHFQPDLTVDRVILIDLGISSVYEGMLPMQAYVVHNIMHPLGVSQLPLIGTDGAADIVVLASQPKGSDLSQCYQPNLIPQHVCCVSLMPV